MIATTSTTALFALKDVPIVHITDADIADFVDKELICVRGLRKCAWPEGVTTRTIGQMTGYGTIDFIYRAEMATARGFI